MKKNSNKTLIATAIVVIIINTFFVQLCNVSGESMFPTLNDGNILIMDKCTKNYERFDIVVAKRSGLRIIKRVIGLPGETVKIENSKIYINGTEINDAVECFTEPGIAENEIMLKENEYFLLGDNRQNSRDSRNETVGVIYGNEIVGEVFYSIIPFKKIK